MISEDYVKTLPRSPWWFTIPANDQKTLTDGQDQDLKILWTAFCRTSSGMFAIETMLTDFQYLEPSI